MVRTTHFILKPKVDVFDAYLNVVDDSGHELLSKSCRRLGFFLLFRLFSENFLILHEELKLVQNFGNEVIICLLLKVRLPFVSWLDLDQAKDIFYHDDEWGRKHIPDGNLQIYSSNLPIC